MSSAVITERAAGTSEKRSSFLDGEVTTKFTSCSIESCENSSDDAGSVVDPETTDVSVDAVASVVSVGRSSAKATTQSNIDRAKNRIKNLDPTSEIFFEMWQLRKKVRQ